MDDCLYWLIQNLTDVPDGEDWLSEKEKALLSRLHVPKRRNDWRLGRWTAKQAYRLYQPAFTPSIPEMDVVAAEDGGPDIYISDKPAPVSISISHSHGRGFCILAPSNFAVGCDLEQIEYRSPDFFEDYFTPEEMLSWRQAPEAIQPIVGYLIWSAKESCLKVLREGLRRDTRSVRINFEYKDAESAWNIWTGHCMETSGTFWGWWRCEGKYIYTMASDRPSGAPRELQI
jgi:4'-phosphopantetheinyl transferase